MLRWKAQLDLQRAVLLAKSGHLEGGKEVASAVMSALPPEQRSTLLVEMWK